MSATHVESSATTVGGKPATLAVFDVVCDDAGEADAAGVQQRQWFIPGTPVGDVVVVDLWWVDGLPKRLDQAVW